MAMVVFSASISAQTTNVNTKVATLESEVKALKTQVETIKGEQASMQSQLAELADRNAQYKKQLDIQQLSKVEKDSIEYGFISALGNKSNGNVIVTMFAVDKGKQEKILQFSHSEFSDYDGNLIKIHEYYDDIKIGGPNGKVLATFKPNIALKFTIAFTGVPVNARIANLEVEGFIVAEKNKNFDLNFKDLPITWK